MIATSRSRGPAPDGVSDTARWVALYRAEESARADALFRDPWAAELAGERGRSLWRSLPSADHAAWAVVVRSRIFDELILAAVETGQFDTLLHLGAGLDTRPYRLPLPASLRVVEVDLPEILTTKERVLADARRSCAVERVPLDLTDLPSRRRWLRHLNRESRSTLVVSEGLLVYLATEEVVSLAADLHATGCCRGWIFDVVSQATLRRMRRLWGRLLADSNVAFRFAPKDVARFFTPLGWSPVEARSLYGESRRLGRRMPRAWIADLFARFWPRRKTRGVLTWGGVVRTERV